MQTLPPCQHQGHLTTAAMVTSSCLSNSISVLVPVPETLLVLPFGNHVSGYHTSSQANPPSGYTIGQTAPIYTRPMTACSSENAAFEFEAYVDIVSSGCVAKPTGNHTSAHTLLTQSHFAAGPCSCVFNQRSITGETTATATFLYPFRLAQAD